MKRQPHSYVTSFQDLPDDIVVSCLCMYMLGGHALCIPNLSSTCNRFWCMLAAARLNAKICANNGAFEWTIDRKEFNAHFGDGGESMWSPKMPLHSPVFYACQTRHGACGWKLKAVPPYAPGMGMLPFLGVFLVPVLDGNQESACSRNVSFSIAVGAPFKQYPDSKQRVTRHWTCMYKDEDWGFQRFVHMTDLQNNDWTCMKITVRVKIVSQQGPCLICAPPSFCV